VAASLREASCMDWLSSTYCVAQRATATQLVLTLEQVVCQRMERFGVMIIKNRQDIVGLARETFGFCARFLQADNRRIRCLLCRHIFAGALAQNFRGLRYVENVVDDLESEPQPLPERCNRGKLSGICVGAHRAQSD